MTFTRFIIAGVVVAGLAAPALAQPDPEKCPEYLKKMETTWAEAKFPEKNKSFCENALNNIKMMCDQGGMMAGEAVNMMENTDWKAQCGVDLMLK